MNGRPGRADLLACLLLGALVVACYAPELLGRRAFFFFDVSSLNLPARDWAFRQIKSGHFPQWCTHWYVGFPFIAESQSGVYYPPNYFFFLLFPSWYATTLAYTSHVSLAGIGAYFLFRRWASMQGAWLGAAAFAVGGRMLEHQIHAAVAETIAWLPLILLGVIRYVEDGSRRALWWSAGLAGIQALAGSLHTVVVSHLAVFVFVISFAGLNRRAFGRSAVASALVGVSAMLLSACLLAPTLELFQQSPRRGGGATEWANFGAISPLRWVQFFLPGAFGSPAHSTAWLNDRDPVFETGLYHGGLVVLLTMLGAFSVAQQRRRAAFAGLVLVLVGLSLAAGDMNLVGAGLRKLPIFGGIRVPARYLLLVGLGMCQLAALGWDELVESAVAARRRLLIALGLTTAASAAAFAWLYGGVLGEWPPHINAPRLNEFLARLQRGMLEADAPRLAATLLAIGLCFVVNRRLAARTAVFVCLALDLGWTVRVKYPTIAPAFHAAPPSVDAVKRLSTHHAPRVFVRWSMNQNRGLDLRADGWRLSTDQYRRIGECLYYERGPLFDVGVFPDVGQLPLQPKRLGAFRTAIADDDRLMRLLGIPLVMSPAAMHDDRVVYRGAGCCLERVPDVPPYALFTADVQWLPDDEILDRLSDPSFTPAAVVFEGSRRQRGARPETAPVQAHWNGPNQLVLDVEAPAEGAVLIHEMHDPGWKAAVDGLPSPVERANGLFMAVMVEPGPHRIVLTYVPSSVRVGRWVSAAALFLWLAAGVRRLGSGPAIAIDHKRLSPWTALAVFLSLFAFSAVLLQVHWAGAFPTSLDPR